MLNTYDNFDIRLELRQLRAEALCQSGQSEFAGDVSRGHWTIASDWKLVSAHIIDVHNNTVVNS